MQSRHLRPRLVKMTEPEGCVDCLDQQKRFPQDQDVSLQEVRLYMGESDEREGKKHTYLMVIH
jgi:hypothetical protein